MEGAGPSNVRLTGSFTLLWRHRAVQLILLTYRRGLCCFLIQSHFTRTYLNFTSTLPFCSLGVKINSRNSKTFRKYHHEVKNWFLCHLWGMRLHQTQTVWVLTAAIVTKFWKCHTRSTFPRGGLPGVHMSLKSQEEFTTISTLRFVLISSRQFQARGRRVPDASFSSKDRKGWGQQMQQCTSSSLDSWTAIYTSSAAFSTKSVEYDTCANLYLSTNQQIQNQQTLIFYILLIKTPALDSHWFMFVGICRISVNKPTVLNKMCTGQNEVICK